MATGPAIGMFVPLMLMLGGVLGDSFPQSTPPREVDERMLSVVPDSCLALVAMTGAAEADAASDNATEALLAEPELRAIGRAIFRAIEGAEKPGAQLPGALPGAEPGDLGNAEAVDERRLLAAAIRTWLASPIVFFVESADIGPDGPDVKAGLVIAPDAAERRLFTAAMEAFEADAPHQLPREQVGEIELRSIPGPGPDAPSLQWAVVGDYMIAATGEGVARRMVERLTAEQPAAMPDWLGSLLEHEQVDRPAAVRYIDMAALRDRVLPVLFGPIWAEARPALEAAGMDNLTTFSAVSGLDATGQVRIVELGLDGPPRGLFAAVGDRPLRVADLRPLPPDATFALAANFDPDRILDTIRAIAVAVEDERAGEDFDADIAMFEEEMGFHPRRDLFDQLGDVWTLYSAAGDGGLGVTASPWGRPSTATCPSASSTPSAGGPKTCPLRRPGPLPILTCWPGCGRTWCEAASIGWAIQTRAPRRAP